MKSRKVYILEMDDQILGVFCTQKEARHFASAYAKKQGKNLYHYGIAPAQFRKQRTK
jgi:hypothetical protein